MSFGRVFALVAVGFGVIVVVLGVICGVFVVRTQAFLAESSSATGRVIALVARETCDEDNYGRDVNCSTAYAPRVRFTTSDGRQVVFESGSASNPPSHQRGDIVDVRYRSSDPTDARIDSIAGVWLGVIITGGLALFFLAFCVVWVVLAVRVRKGQAVTASRAA
jgi:hypothetical protein